MRSRIDQPEESRGLSIVEIDVERPAPGAYCDDPRRGRGVVRVEKLTASYWASRFVGARRVEDANVTR